MVIDFITRSPELRELHIDVTVVGVPAEPVTTSFQLLVQLVEQDVRQQR